jgi:hypothetical protein
MQPEIASLSGGLAVLITSLGLTVCCCSLICVAAGASHNDVQRKAYYQDASIQPEVPACTQVQKKGWKQ